LQVFGELCGEGDTAMTRRLYGVVVAAGMLCASAQAQEVVTIGAGVWSGSKSQPIPSISGVVLRIIEPGPPIKFETTGRMARLVKVYYMGEVVQRGLAKPTAGNVGELYIGDENVKLKCGDISTGYLQTEDYGDVLLFFLPSVSTEKCFVAMSPQQLGEAAPTQAQATEVVATDQPEGPHSRGPRRTLNAFFLAAVALAVVLIAVLSSRKRAKAG
jgi:hypothetical protein